MRADGMSRKLRSRRGETLVEVMASIVIGALSVALLFGCVMASSRIDSAAARMDRDYYAGLSDAEAQSAPAAGAGGTVTVENGGIAGTGVTVDVNVYGGAGMYSYRVAP